MIRLILLALLLATGVVLLRLVWRLLCKILQSAIELGLILLKVAGAALAAAVAALIGLFLLYSTFEGEWSGAALMGVATLVFVLCLRKFLGRKAGTASPMLSKEDDRESSLSIVEEPIKPEADPRITDAWNIAAELAPEYARRLSVARRGCAQVLEMATAEAVEWSVIDCSTFISRTIPEAVATAAALMKDADYSERSGLAYELVVDLERISQRAREEVKGHRHRLRNNWDVMRTHIASRTSRDAL